MFSSATLQGSVIVHVGFLSWQTGYAVQLIKFVNWLNLATCKLVRGCVALFVKCNVCICKVVFNHFFVLVCPFLHFRFGIKKHTIGGAYRNPPIKTQSISGYIVWIKDNIIALLMVYCCDKISIFKKKRQENLFGFNH